MIKVIVASKNPVKINATKEGFCELFPDEEISVEGMSVPSEVSEQPMTDEETLRGAKNRATNAQNNEPSADYWVGIEGGLHPQNDSYLAFAWVVILSKNQYGESRTSTFNLPQKIAALIDQGVELGLANDQVFNESNSKQKGGAVGTLTHGVLGRTAYYVQPVVLALVPFINPRLFPSK